MNQPIEKFWRMVAQEAGSEPSAYDLMLFNALGDPWAGDDTTWASKFTEELWKLPKSVKRLNLHINSPGGSVSEAQAIYSALADHSSEKVVYIDGLAASAATIPAMVGHKVYIRSNANMMIHLPLAMAVGNSDKMREAISMLESITESIINVYQKKSGLDRDKIRALMEKETWFTAKEAVENNFADEVRGVVKAAASIGNNRVIFNGREFDLASFRYHNTPVFPEATMKMKNITATVPPSPEPPVKEEPEAPPAPAPVEPPAPSEADEPKARLLATAMADFEHISPALAQAFHERGVQAERTRLAGLERFTDPACAGIVAAARADGRTAEQIALECYDVLVRAGRQDARRSDASVLANVKSGDAPFQGLGKKVNGTSPAVRASAVSALVEAGKKAHKRN